MTPVLRAVEPGAHVTLQDIGRFGWRRFGVAGAGAMDPDALLIANALIGNPPNSAALEFAHAGGVWRVEAASCRVAVTGGAFTLSSDDGPLAPWRSHRLVRGQTLTIGGTRDAVWGYLAVAGGFVVAPRLGSRSTHLRSGIGGIAGRRLQAGDAIPLLLDAAPLTPEARIPQPRRSTGPLRVVMGPQRDFFSSDTIGNFLASSWRVTHRGDRMGTWLEGPALPHEKGFNIVSDGLVPGCIQIPGGGQPVVLMMDCQTMGGYPKLATIITPDLPRFAQIRPGGLVSFAAHDIETAQRVYRDYRERRDRVASRIEPARV